MQRAFFLIFIALTALGISTLCSTQVLAAHGRVSVSATVIQTVRATTHTITKVNSKIVNFAKRLSTIKQIVRYALNTKVPVAFSKMPITYVSLSSYNDCPVYIHYNDRINHINEHKTTYFSDG